MQGIRKEERKINESRGEVTMESIRTIDLDSPLVCPHCGGVITPVNLLVLSQDDNGESFTCTRCARIYRRIGAGCRFASSDGCSMLVPEATPTATV